MSRKIIKVQPKESYEAIQWDGTEETYQVMQQFLIDVPGFGGLVKLKNDHNTLLVLAPGVALQEGKSHETLLQGWWIVLVEGRFVQIMSDLNFGFSYVNENGNALPVTVPPYEEPQEVLPEVEEGESSERPVNKVLEAIFSQVPLDFKHREDMKRAFTRQVDDACYAAPENQAHIWQDAAQTLSNYIGDPSGTPWKELIANLFMGKEPYRKYVPKKFVLVK